MTDLVRYCYECGSIGEVPAGARDCCPDGNHATRIHPEIAAQAHAGFLHQLEADPNAYWLTRAHMLCTDAGVPQGEIWTRIEALRIAFERQQEQVNALLNHCDEPECATCSTIICPHEEPMHFHHDGCPACAEREGGLF